jgi:hypothetical protein
MSKKNKPSATGDPQRAAARRRWMIHGIALLVVIGAAAFGFSQLLHYVNQCALLAAKPPQVVLANRPPWMSDRVADRIIALAQPATAHGVFDRQLLVDINDLLRANPWVRQVKQVRRGYLHAPGDVLEIDCDYRAPIALVHWKDFYWLVDGEGTSLPEQYTVDQLHQIMYAPDGQLIIRVVEGIIHDPPGTGHHWNGDDLAAAIDLVKFLYGKPYAQEAYKVDVANFGGRVDPREAQIVLWTTQKIGDVQTQVRWGRPIYAKDFFVEISPAQKLERMEKLVAKYHRLDANRTWVDLRFDQVIGLKDEEADVH